MQTEFYLQFFITCNIENLYMKIDIYVYTRVCAHIV